jgi:CIC family chloride channel protein
MSRSWETISHSMPLGRFLRLVEESRFSCYPVVNDTGDLEGVLSLQDVKSLITKRGLEDLIIVKDVMPGYIQTLTEDETLASALQKFGLQDVEALPVVYKQNPKKLVGILKRSDIITFYNRKLLERTGKS